MTLAFFILSALDLLNAGPDTFPESQRKEIRDWILACQHPHGGFCGSPNHRYPDGFYEGEESMDPANLPATYFALLILGFVGGLAGVDRRGALRWLGSLQREDGSFGEFVREGKVEGGYDMRYCYVLTCVRWILRGNAEGPVGGIQDIDVEGLVDHLRRGQTYDGGISESDSHEAHAGYTYCAIASLAMLNRLPKPNAKSDEDKPPGLTDVSATISWLMSRQVGYTSGEEDEDDEDSLPDQDQRDALAGIYKDPSAPKLPPQLEEYVGFNGRCNKTVDTCYAFWVTASLSILNPTLPFLLPPSTRSFLYTQTQHTIGGFSKYPSDPPDIYHSYLGLAALAVMKEPGLKELDEVLCVSREVRRGIEEFRGRAG